MNIMVSSHGNNNRGGTRSSADPANSNNSNENSRNINNNINRNRNNSSNSTNTNNELSIRTRTAETTEGASTSTATAVASACSSGSKMSSQTTTTSNKSRTGSKTNTTTVVSAGANSRKSSSKKPPSLSLEETNMKRCNEMLECQKQITYWKRQLSQFKSDHNKAQLLATLKCKSRAVTTWNSLHKKEKWKKPYVLLILQCAQSKMAYTKTSSFDRMFTTTSDSSKKINGNQDYIHHQRKQLQEYIAQIQQQQQQQHQKRIHQNDYHLPMALQEHTWEKGVPAKLKNDRDIFLARIATWQFRLYHNHCHCIVSGTSTSSNGSASGGGEKDNSSYFIIPDRFWNDKEVMKQIIFYYPELLMSAHSNPLFPSQFWQDPEIFQQLIMSPNISHCKLSLREIMNQFDLETIRNDCNWMLLAVQRSCFCFDMIHPSLREDKQFVLDAFQACGEYMPAENLLCCSDALRSDMDVVFEAVRRNGLAIKYALHGLQKHYKVILEAARNDPMSFVYARHSDAKLKLRGLKWFWVDVVFAKLASSEYYHILSNNDLASSNNNTKLATKTIEDCAELAIGSDTTKDKSTTLNDGDDDYKSNKNVLHLRKLWSLVNPRFRESIDVVIPAILAGCITLKDVSDKLKKNEKFWLNLIEVEPSVWYELPSTYKHNTKFVFPALQRSTDETLITEVFYRFPELQSNRDIWLTIVQSAMTSLPSSTVSVKSNRGIVFGVDVLISSIADNWSSSSLSDILMNAPTSILEDKEIMLKACSVDFDTYELLGFPLCEDREIIEATLKCSSEALHYISSDIQLRYPDLIANAIRALPHDLWDVFDSIDEALWATNRDCALAWVSRGGDYLHDEFPSEYENDREIFLQIAKHNPHDFWCSGESLCRNKEFMLQVVEINGHLLCEAWSTLCKDFDLAVVAFASTPDLPNRYDINDPDDFTFITTLAKDIRKRIQEHSNFQKIVLCAMAGNPGPNCCLPLLDQGKETALAFRTILADFIDVPTGKHLRQLRQASTNLSTWGF